MGKISRFATSTTTDRASFGNTALHALWTSCPILMCIMNTGILDYAVPVTIPAVFVSSSSAVNTRYSANTFAAVTSDYFRRSGVLDTLSNRIWRKRRRPSSSKLGVKIISPSLT